jgi:hypothetical protein
LRILEELTRRRGELSIAEYLDAVDHSISRQQARSDLLGHPRLELVGRGRGARWRLK